jgi:hypothetical protein
LLAKNGGGALANECGIIGNYHGNQQLTEAIFLIVSAAGKRVSMTVFTAHPAPPITIPLCQRTALRVFSKTKAPPLT